jgi:hypothetical protein
MGIVLAAQMFGAKDLQSVLAENAHHDIAPHAFARSLTATKYNRNTGWRSGILKLPSSNAALPSARTSAIWRWIRRVCLRISRRFSWIA